MNAGFGRHFTEERTWGRISLCALLTADMWEEYALGLRSENVCAVLEEHLLMCSACQDLLAKADEYIQVMKAAAAALAATGHKEREPAGRRGLSLVHQ